MGAYHGIVGMRSILVSIGIVVACFALAFLPQAFWPDWPVQIVIGVFMLGGTVAALVNGLRSGEFHTNHGVSQRKLDPIGFYANAVLLSIGVLFLVAMLAAKTGAWFGQLGR
jgi:hypothetical protein